MQALKFVKVEKIMRYIVSKTEEINPDINSLEWDKAEVGYIDKEPWTKEGLFSSPKTTFKLLRGPEGVSVLMHTNETNLRAEEEKENGPICCDSCMEFFYKPSPWDPRYFNFEINPKGVMHLGLGDGRFGRVLIEERELFDIVSIANDGDWTIKYYIPDSFIENYFPGIYDPSNVNTSSVVKGNFFKCGDKTDKPHYAVWSNIEVDIDDFHVPDFFGKIVF